MVAGLTLTSLTERPHRTSGMLPVLLNQTRNTLLSCPSPGQASSIHEHTLTKLPSRQGFRRHVQKLYSAENSPKTCTTPTETKIHLAAQGAHVTARSLKDRVGVRSKKLMNKTRDIAWLHSTPRMWNPGLWRLERFSSLSLATAPQLIDKSKRLIPRSSSPFLRALIIYLPALWHLGTW